MRNHFAALVFLIVTPSLASATTVTFDAPGLFPSPIDVLSFSQGAGMSQDFHITVPLGAYSPDLESAVATGKHFADGTLTATDVSGSETFAFTQIVFTDVQTVVGGTNEDVTFTYDTLQLTSQPTPVPEPATMTLTAIGLAGLVRRYRRKRSR